MLLGTLMHRLQNEATSTEVLLSLGDLVLISEIDAARAPHDETTGEYMTNAVKRFAYMAGDEDWLRLMTALEQSDQPAAACLRTMLRWSINQEAQHLAGPDSGCSCGGSDGGCHDQS